MIQGYIRGLSGYINNNLLPSCNFIIHLINSNNTFLLLLANIILYYYSNYILFIKV